MYFIDCLSWNWRMFVLLYSFAFMFADAWQCLKERTYKRRVQGFGSFLTDVPRLGDVDVAVQLDTKLPNDGHRVERYRAHCRQAALDGRRFPSYRDRLGWPEREVLLHLKSRSRGLSLHRMSDLESLGTASVLLYPKCWGDVYRTVPLGGFRLRIPGTVR